jgi:hypothetical protein
MRRIYNGVRKEAIEEGEIGEEEFDELEEKLEVAIKLARTRTSRRKCVDCVPSDLPLFFLPIDSLTLYARL